MTIDNTARRNKDGKTRRRYEARPDKPLTQAQYDRIRRLTADVPVSVASVPYRMAADRYWADTMTEDYDDNMARERGERVARESDAYGGRG
jgi:hypothetical protein